MNAVVPLLLGSLIGCSPAKDPSRLDSGHPDTGNNQEDTATDTVPPSDSGGEEPDTGFGADTGLDTGAPPADPYIPDWPDGTDPFADAVVEFTPGPDAGFGSDEFPEVVLGPPQGSGGGAGSLDVLSLGELGSITLEMTDLEIIDGPGPDLLVFENPFPGWLETGVVEASLDGIDWYAWPCSAEDADGDFPGCAGTAAVYATADFWVDPTDPVAAGGDAFDLADLGLPAARFVRISDSGYNFMRYGGTTGGFDLDAIAAANWAVISVD